jgi:hypothetical protein
VSLNSSYMRVCMSVFLYFCVSVPVSLFGCGQRSQEDVQRNTKQFLCTELTSPFTAFSQAASVASFLFTVIRMLFMQCVKRWQTHEARKSAPLIFDRDDDRQELEGTDTGKDKLRAESRGRVLLP